MDINKLLKALDNESNDSIFHLNSKKIKEMNLQVIKELKLPREKTLKIMSKLNEYRYVDEVNDLKYGTYLRWIPLNDDIKDEDIELTRGAIFCEVKITDDGIYLVCKNIGYYKKHFQLKLDDNLIFQKLTHQELVIIGALNHLE